MTIGIYKITNLINNKSYIGKSKNIENRFAYHKMPSCWLKEKNKPLYRAFQKYGIDSFTFDIIEECSADELNNKEIYWIGYYNSYKNGYNATIGGDGGKTSNQGTFSKDEIKQIRQYYLDCKYTCKEIYEKFYKDRITLRGFRAIWDGTNYKDIMPEIYTEENKKKHISLGRKREGVSRRKIDLETIKAIRARLANNKNETMKNIWKQEYQDIYSYGGFRDVITKKHPDEEDDWYA